MTFLVGLACLGCGAIQSDMERRFRCAQCDGFLEARYDLAAARRLETSPVTQGRSAESCEQRFLKSSAVQRSRR